MLIYHRTHAAEAIFCDGFRDTTGRHLTTDECPGVWVSDRPLDTNHGATGHALLGLVIPDAVFAAYERIESGKQRRTGKR